VSTSQTTISLNTTQSANSTTVTTSSQTNLSSTAQTWTSKDPEQSLPVNPSSSNSPTTNVNRIAVIASISVFFGLLLIALLAWWFLWKKRQRQFEGQGTVVPIDSSITPFTTSNFTHDMVSPSNATSTSNLGKTPWVIGTDESGMTMSSPDHVTPVDRTVAPLHLDLPPAYELGSSPYHQGGATANIGLHSDRKRRLNT
jgi:hypothetical protein